MFTFEEMKAYAYWYNNGLTNLERSELGEQGAFDVWFENYGSMQIEKLGFGKSRKKANK